MGHADYKERNRKKVADDLETMRKKCIKFNLISSESGHEFIFGNFIVFAIKLLKKYPHQTYLIQIYYVM